MPGKRRTRAACRSKPVLANITSKLNIIDSKEKQRRAFLIDDFRRNVALKLEMLQEEERQLEASLWKSYKIYREQLLPWQNITVQQLVQCDDTISAPQPAPQATKLDKNIPSSTSQNTATAGLGGAVCGELPPSAEDTGLASLSTTDAAEGSISDVKTNAKRDLSESKIAQSDTVSADAAEKSTCPNVLGHDEPGVFAKPLSFAPKTARMSDITALIVESSELTAVQQKKKTRHRTPAVPVSVTRSSSRLRRGDGAPAHMAPPSSARISRAKKVSDYA
ncbi:hypothetical protein FHG87_015958 [Trinorchestia longiramus]|nr:hypothetical protein FHG87_015958 [Trinorchestia longiramus]